MNTSDFQVQLEESIDVMGDKTCRAVKFVLLSCQKTVS